MNITFGGESVQYNPAPKYLDFTLDQSNKWATHRKVDTEDQDKE